MRQRSSEQGVGLIMVIGIIAALAIMAATMVVLISNMQHNTSNERTRSKSFDVSEGALDYYMNQLALNWPKGTPTAPTFGLSAFQALSLYQDKTEYPDPAAGLGSFASVVAYDNDQTVGGTQNVGYSPTLSAHGDVNGDGKVWLVARGATGKRASAIQAEVNRTPVNTSFPKGIVVYAGGNLTSNGGGNNPKIVIEDSGGSSVNGYVKGSIDTTSVFQSGISVPPSSQVPDISTLFPDALINQIIGLAQSLGRYYDTTQGAAMPSNLSGICVIRVANGTNVSLGNNGGINSLTSPGILMILGPEGGSGNAITMDMGGNQTFYGVLFTDGRFYSSHGTPDIHGMVVCRSNLDMKGTPAIRYNASVIANLADQWTLTVNLVPNTWREIHP